jgi:hypothetical protein
MSNNKALVIVFLVLVGMFGLYNKVEYSGWVLFVGLLMAL